MGEIEKGGEANEVELSQWAKEEKTGKGEDCQDRRLEGRKLRKQKTRKAGDWEDRRLGWLKTEKAGD